MTLWSMVTEKTASDHSAQITTSSFTVLKSQANHNFLGLQFFTYIMTGSKLPNLGYKQKYISIQLVSCVILLISFKILRMHQWHKRG